MSRTLDPLPCPRCAAFALELDRHAEAVHDGIATADDRIRLQRLAAVVDRLHHVAGNPPRRRRPHSPEEARP